MSAVLEQALQLTAPWWPGAVAPWVTATRQPFSIGRKTCRPRPCTLRSNVETELANDDSGAGCGCAYPDYVDDADVSRSNSILQRLRSVARTCCHVRQQLAQLAMHAVARVGDVRIGLVHGDAKSLAGWRFDAAALQQLENAPWLERVLANPWWTYLPLAPLARRRFTASRAVGGLAMPSSRTELPASRATWAAPVVSSPGCLFMTRQRVLKCSTVA